MKIIPSGQCIYNYPAAFPGLDGCGKQQALPDTKALLCATALVCYTASILTPLIWCVPSCVLSELGTGEGVLSEYLKPET